MPSAPPTLPRARAPQVMEVDGCMLADLKAAEFPLMELKDWYSASDLLEIGFTVQQMRIDSERVISQASLPDPQLTVAAAESATVR